MCLMINNDTPVLITYISKNFIQREKYVHKILQIRINAIRTNGTDIHATRYTYRKYACKDLSVFP